MMLCSMAQLTWKQGDYLSGLDLITWALKQRRQRDLKHEKKDSRVRAGLKTGGSAKKGLEQPKELRVRPPAGTEYCQPPERTWKQALPQSLHKGMLLCWPGFQPSKTLSRESSHTVPDSQATELWAKKWVLFYAARFGVIIYKAIEN